MGNQTPSVDQFYANSDLTPQSAASLVKNGLRGSDFGELYVESKKQENLTKDKGIFSVSLGNSSSGFGFRAGLGEHMGYSFASQFDKATLQKAIASSRTALKGRSGQQDLSFGRITALTPTLSAVLKQAPKLCGSWI